MQKIFNTIAREINRRNTLRQQIIREFDLIRGDKLVSQTDIFASFYDADTGAPKGSVGTNFHYYAEHFHTRLEDIESEKLPITLGTTLSRENFARAKIQYDAAQESKKQKLRLEVDSYGLDFVDHQPDQFSDHMTLIYADDFFRLISKELRLKKILHLSAFIGNAEESLEITQSLRHLPDYSGHFPQRPPRNGTGRKNDAPDRAIPMGNLNAI